MDIDAGAIAQGAGTAFIAIGLVATWVRNGRSQGIKYGAIQNELKNNGAKADALTTTVQRMDAKLDKFQLHCADTSGRIDERLHATERDINDLKSRER